MKKFLYTAAVIAAFTGIADTAHAQDASGIFSKDRFQLRMRAIGIVPDDDSSVNIGGDVDVGNAVTPEVDLTYFFTENIAA